MTTVRIVGGGLVGVLAALEAHRLGAREIILHERHPDLGGSLKPRLFHGLELRDQLCLFGDRTDPMRQLLAWRGVVFEEFENAGAAVFPGPGGEPAGGRAFAGFGRMGETARVLRPEAETLADRLRACPPALQGALSRYAQWRLGAWLDQVHGAVAESLAIAPSPGAPIPGAGGLAALPRGGFAHLFEAAGRALTEDGVEVKTGSLASPRELIALARGGEVVVWTAEPDALFPLVDRPPVRPLADRRSAYVFRTQHGGPAPFVVQNFTACGTVARVALYTTRGETLALVECIAEAPEAEVRRQAQRLAGLSGGEPLSLGERLAQTVRARGDGISMDTARTLAQLRAGLARDFGSRFVLARREITDLASRFRALSVDLSQALPRAARRAA